MELKEKIIATLSSWTSMSDLVSKTEEEKGEVRDMVTLLLTEGLIAVTGKGRGTKYAIPGTAKEAGRNLKSEILTLMATESWSRKELCDDLTTDDLIVYDIQVKTALDELITEGLVTGNGKKRGQKFWLSDGEAPENEESESFESQVLEELALGSRTIKNLNEKLGSYPVKTKNCLEELIGKGLVQTNGAKRGTVYWLIGEDNVQEVGSDTDGPMIDNFDELLRLGIPHIPLDSGHDQSEILKIICEASNNELSQWNISVELSKAISAGRHGFMWRNEMDIQSGGNRVKVYLGTMPSLDK